MIRVRLWVQIEEAVNENIIIQCFPLNEGDRYEETTVFKTDENDHPKIYHLITFWLQDFQNAAQQQYTNFLMDAEVIQNIETDSWGMMLVN